MGNEDWAQDKINAWLAQGDLAPEHVILRLDKNVEGSYAIQQDEREPLQAAFASASTPAPSGNDRVLTESSFVSLLHAKAALPRCPDGVAAGRIIYETLGYLSTLPFPRRNSQSQSQGDGLSLAQIKRALAWALPDRWRHIVEQGNFSRIRTGHDRQRLLFQSLATGTAPSSTQDEIRTRARSLARRHAFDVPEMFSDFSVVNNDEDGDEIYHDLLDILYSTQEVKDISLSPVHRDAFRNIAKQIKGEEQIPELHTLAIPAQRFKDLVKVLLALQTEPINEGDIVKPSEFEDAAQAVCAAFTREDGVITWPSFSHALENSAPHLLDPLYRLLSLALLGKGSPIEVLDAPEAPSEVPEGSILTLPRASQIVSIFAETFDAGALQRIAHYTSPRLTAPSTFIQAIQNVPDEAIVLFSGRTTAEASARKGELCIFGLFSPAPKKDGSRIQSTTEIDPDNAGQQSCALFQLAPVQDVFRGVVGAAGWSLVTDAEGRESVVFGQTGAAESPEEQKGGMTLTLRDGLQRAEIRHWGKGVDEDTNESRAEGIVYKANSRRGDWALEFAVENIEIWSEPKE
ncbi:hypothetical protein F4776DRAFT_629392 [Hypoxylon sp. NC0597]|nr:hypothetical protein F4776DRAFT_629392 [Hypoxylon sp. NC0597]